MRQKELQDLIIFIANNFGKFLEKMNVAPSIADAIRQGIAKTEFASTTATFTSKQKNLKS